MPKLNTLAHTNRCQLSDDADRNIILNLHEKTERKCFTLVNLEILQYEQRDT